MIIISFIVYMQGMRVPSYDNQLLNLAEDLARRLLPAFDTPTGITRFIHNCACLLVSLLSVYPFEIKYTIFLIFTFDAIVRHCSVDRH